MLIVRHLQRRNRFLNLLVGFHPTLLCSSPLGTISEFSNSFLKTDLYLLKFFFGFCHKRFDIFQFARQGF